MIIDYSKMKSATFIRRHIPDGNFFQSLKCSVKKCYQYHFVNQSQVTMALDLSKIGEILQHLFSEKGNVHK